MKIEAGMVAELKELHELNWVKCVRWVKRETWMEQSMDGDSGLNSGALGQLHFAAKILSLNLA